MAVSPVGGMGDVVETVDTVNGDGDSAEEVIQHPLQHTWTLWYYENDRQKSWEDNQRQVTDFHTVEDFWRLHNNIKSASDLRQGCDYSLFKKGIRPMWEDSANKLGGRWLINVEKKLRGPELDHVWLEVLLCLIGEAFDDFGDDVCGAVVNLRSKGDKIAVWTANVKNQQAVLEIGRKLKSRLNIPHNSQICYQVHEDTMVKSGSMTKNTFTL